jgi:hypothetical protein
VTVGNVAGGAGALAGLDPQETRRLLARLVARHLVEERATDRYSCHDLLRLYARSLTWTDDDPQSGLDRRAPSTCTPPARPQV